MADIENGTQFCDLPSCLAIDILLRLPVKTLLICRYVRKDWTRLYFLDPYFIGRQLETSNIQFLSIELIEGRKFRFGSFVDELSIGNLRMETLDFSCKLPHNPKYEWGVINACNGLVCLVDKPYEYYGTTDNSSVYVGNPILGEWVSIPVPNRCYCALGFSAKNNQYKILSCVSLGDMETPKYEWEIYTPSTGQWRSIETKETIKPWCSGLNFNTFIHGSLHWTNAYEYYAQSFDFETERFTVLCLPETESAEIQYKHVTLGVINGCLWAWFTNGMQRNDGEMWAMKEYGVDESWTMMLAMRADQDFREYDPPNEVLKARHKELVIYKDDICGSDLLFTLNGDEMLTSQFRVVCYNITTGNRRRELSEGQYISSVAYNPSFVSLHDVGRGEEGIRCWGPAHIEEFYLE